MKTKTYKVETKALKDSDIDLNINILQKEKVLHTYIRKMEADLKKYFNIDGNNPMIGQAGFASNEIIEECFIIPDSDNAKLGYGMFAGLSAKKMLHINETKGTEKLVSLSAAFYYNTALEELNLSKWNVSNVADMSSIFYNCPSLKKINLSNWKAESCTNMSAMFALCGALTELKLTDFRAPVVTNMSNVFAGCSHLTELDVSGFNTSAVTDMSVAFGQIGANAEKPCVISGLEKLDVSNVTNMSNMFMESNITHVDISKWNLNAKVDVDSMFKDSKVKEVTVCDFSKLEGTQDMFADCPELTTINGVVDLAKAFPTGGATNMFKGCPKLSGVKIRLPKDSLTGIYKHKSNIANALGLSENQFEIVD